MAASYPQFVLLGDSLFQNSIGSPGGYSFHAAVQSLCVRELDVVNRGFSGYTTKNLLTYLDQIFPEKTSESSSGQLKYLAILIGANDAVLPWAPTKQHIPVDEYKDNLIKIITHPRIQQHKPKIFLVTPPPVDELKHTKLDQSNGLSSSIRTSAISSSYSEKVREVAKENPDVTLVDLWQALMDKAIAMAPQDYQPGGPWLGSPENGKAGGLESLLPDGLHMSDEAYGVFFKTIQPFIETEFKKAKEGKEEDGDFVYPRYQRINGIYVSPSN